MTKHSPTARPEGPLPPCLVTVPAGLEPGMTFQFMLPPPAPTATVAVAVGAPPQRHYDGEKWVTVAAPAAPVAAPAAPAAAAETSEAENPVAKAQ